MQIIRLLLIQLVTPTTIMLACGPCVGFLRALWLPKTCFMCWFLSLNRPLGVTVYESVCSCSVLLRAGTSI